MQFSTSKIATTTDGSEWKSEDSSRWASVSTPLLTKKEYTKEEFAKTLLEQKSDQEAVDFLAQVLNLKDLIDAPVKTTAVGPTGCTSLYFGTALHKTAKEGWLEATKIITNAGANLKLETIESYNALDIAAKHGHYYVAAWFIIDKKMSITTTKAYGNPGGILAVGGMFGAVVSNRKGEPKVPLIHLAILGGNIDLLRLLLDRGISANLSTKNYGPPLEWAVIDHIPHWRELATLLLQKGAKIEENAIATVVRNFGDDKLQKIQFLVDNSKNRALAIKQAIDAAANSDENRIQAFADALRQEYATELQTEEKANSAAPQVAQGPIKCMFL